MSIPTSRAIGRRLIAGRSGRIPSGEPGRVGGAASRRYRLTVAGWTLTIDAISTGVKPSERNHRVRNLLAKVLERERERVRKAYWQALDEAINDRDGNDRLQALVGELDRAGYTAGARLPGDYLDALVVPPDPSSHDPAAHAQAQRQGRALQHTLAREWAYGQR